MRLCASHQSRGWVTDWDRPSAVEVSDGRVTYRQTFVDMPLQAVYAVPAGKPVGKRMNRVSWGTQLTPGAHHGGVEKSRAMADIVFGEDIAIVTASQEMSRCSVDHNGAEVSVQSDQAAIQGRRLVAALVAAERAAAAQRGQGSTG